jgi:phage baseplate assembly protein W
MAKITDRFRYSDLDFNFAKSASNDVARKFDSNAIKQSLRNLLLTNFYERPFRPSLGSNLISRLFDTFTEGDLSEIRQNIADVITNFEPRVTLRTIKAEYNDASQTLKIDVEYSFLDNEDTLDIVIERVK